MTGLSLNLKHKQKQLKQKETTALKDYLVKAFNIQKVSQEELYIMFSHSIDYMENRDIRDKNKALEGLFYTQTGKQFISFRNVNGICDAKDFNCEVKALCWLAGTC